jgi:DNA-directed RNA polymerase subunit beta'
VSKDLWTFLPKTTEPIDFEAIRIALASPDKVKEWSHGEVKKPETINYRTFKPERDGLFCARIFGPVKDYECLCGKYKRMKHRGIVCEKCGVEVISSKVRRTRMGHISLATPVAHIWFLKSLPSRIGYVLDIPLKQLERVLYCEAYTVVDPGESGKKIAEVLDEEQYYALEEEFGPTGFRADMGGSAIKELLENLSLETKSAELRKAMEATKSVASRKKLAKRLRVIESLRDSGADHLGNERLPNRAEWMMVGVVPVLPPDLRPLVPLDGGRFATSDLNDLYRRVINRNNRLKRLLELNAPNIIVRNEKRMLQEAVDALFDNGRRGKAITGQNSRPLKSLSDMLKGKQGRFRQNLLGKRVDYSGRSVIVVGPELKLHQCGLPKVMALELFKPFIFKRLEDHGYVTNIKSAKRMVERQKKEVWDILDEVIQEHPVILNRAPTLHRLGMQSFEAVLVEGKAIRLHPLVCVAFNADFDGDQMAVHLPLSIEAQVEARVLMMSSNNILHPAHGKPIIVPTQDLVLGCYYMTRERPFVLGTGMVFSSMREVRIAYDAGAVAMHAAIKVRDGGQLIETTVGRVLLYEVVPKEVPFENVNKVMNKKQLGILIDDTFRAAGQKATVLVADRVRTLGLNESTKAGISIALDHMNIPEEKAGILKAAEEEVSAAVAAHARGVISDSERYNKVIDIWSRANEEVTTSMMKGIEWDVLTGPEGETVETPSFNSIYIMADSGARGSTQQMRQLAGMRGLMAKPSGDIIEQPITANFREGLTALQYFISTHGARKGLADTALKTANSGYLTRRLVDVAQDAIVTEWDCGTIDGIDVTPLVEGGEVIQNIGDRILGRVLLEDVIDPHTGDTLVAAGTTCDEAEVAIIEDAGIQRVAIRSVLTCQTLHGICVQCYGRDLARGHLVNIGEAVGVVAAQSIGEPGTQLTMRTFHIGGAASAKLEEARHECQGGGKVSFVDLGKNYAEMTDDDGGKYLVCMARRAQIKIIDTTGRERETYPLVYGANIYVRDGEEVPAGHRLCDWDAFSTPVLAPANGTVRFQDLHDDLTFKVDTDDRSGRTERIIIEPKNATLRPALVVTSEAGEEFAITLPVGAILANDLEDQASVKKGQVIARKVRETAKTKDITGGLPRVIDLFEARKPRSKAVVSEIAGTVRDGGEKKGKRILQVYPDVEGAKPMEYPIPKGRHLTVHPGDYVRPGEALTEGEEDLHDILRIKGPKELAAHMVDKIQEVYRLQGVGINDKHVEAIVRQMMRRVRVLGAGDSDFLPDDIVERRHFEAANNAIIEAGRIPATAEPILQGITKASLNTTSWISAASFQETTKVLTEAALCGKVDNLKGLKENITVGRLIPAGTGIEHYKYLETEVDEIEGIPDDLLMEASSLYEI